MNTAARTDIRKQAKQRIDRADDTTVRMILAMLDVQANEDTAFDAEMVRRIEEYEQGKITPISLEQVEASARAAHKKKLKATK